MSQRQLFSFTCHHLSCDAGVLDETRRIAKRQAESTAKAPESRESSPQTYVSESATAELTKGADANVLPEPSSSGNLPSTLVTENGETMLHPELLTQESLASPPAAEDL
ncbi:hypothetical protein B0F90DRAFT_43229 [Multifurca ochricompacta]|uniref:Uncharacterized protein n=1 Tax=Multifurca ochricompacta TaxID=376703 RepID=A0AAD4MC65_9AGAM|nr:hypothetical protein B0F90DRAFT_43229 [Multifurca ochricompacta]